MADQENKIVPIRKKQGGPPPLSADKSAAPPEEEQASEELAVRELTEEERIIAEVWQDIFQHNDRAIRIMQRFADSLRQLAIFAVQSSIQSPQTQAVVFPHFAASLVNGFVLGYLAREKVGKKGASRPGN